MKNGGGISPTADMTALSCRKPSLYILLFLVSFFLSVPLGAQDVPEWVVHYRRVYPDSQYIAQRGGGESAEDARNDALSALARYVNLRVESSVKTARSTEIQSLNSGDASVAVSYEKSETSQETTVTSDIELPGVEMTEPYYYEAAGSWYCVAYLNRARAYLHLQPEIEDAQSVFMSFIGRAKKEKDAALRRSLYKKAWDAGGDFLSKLAFARLLSDSADEDFAEGRETLFGIPALMNGEAEKLAVAIFVDGDSRNIISGAVGEAFSAAGFLVTSDGGENYEAHVSVSANPVGERPLAVFPSVTVELRAADGKHVFSYQDKISQETISYTLEKAKQKSYPLLAGIIKENLSAALSEKFGGSK